MARGWIAGTWCDEKVRPFPRTRKSIPPAPRTQHPFPKIPRENPYANTDSLCYTPFWQSPFGNGTNEQVQILDSGSSRWYCSNIHVSAKF